MNAPVSQAMPLIGLYSAAPQSGKTTVAKELVKRGFVIHSFAGTLKKMLKTMLTEFGMSEDEIDDRLYGLRKEEIVPGIGKSCREMLQTLGTDWGRNLVSDSLWVDVAIARAKKAGTPVVFDDMRFPNEAEAVKRAGGMCVAVERPGVERRTTHASEGALDSVRFDCVILNNSTVENLGLAVDDLLRLGGANIQASEKPLEQLGVLDVLPDAGITAALGFYRGVLRDCTGLLRGRNGSSWLVPRVDVKDGRVTLVDLGYVTVNLPVARFEITGPGRYKTRDGRVAEIVAYCPERNWQYPWVGYIFGIDVFEEWASDGKWDLDEATDDFDIVERIS